MSLPTISDGDGEEDVGVGDTGVERKVLCPPLCVYIAIPHTPYGAEPVSMNQLALWEH